MQYILTKEELDRLESDKATRMLVEFIEAVSPVTSLPKDAPEEERDKRVEKSMKDMHDIAIMFGADFSRVDQIYQELAERVKSP